mmetsp:Transcript_90812/g.161660  ORF Transcript_90812/g.161660 Transcript_90812/m.161660 type:complete len:269 (-) Transcript_90812:2711-3517(-)
MYHAALNLLSLDSGPLRRQNDLEASLQSTQAGDHIDVIISSDIDLAQEEALLFLHSSDAGDFGNDKFIMLRVWIGVILIIIFLGLFAFIFLLRLLLFSRSRCFSSLRLSLLCCFALFFCLFLRHSLFFFRLSGGFLSCFFLLAKTLFFFANLSLLLLFGTLCLFCRFLLFSFLSLRLLLRFVFLFFNLALLRCVDLLLGDMLGFLRCPLFSSLLLHTLNLLFSFCKLMQDLVTVAVKVLLKAIAGSVFTHPQLTVNLCDESRIVCHEN